MTTDSKIVRWSADSGMEFTLRIRPLTNREVTLDLNTNLPTNDEHNRSLNYSNLTVDAARQVIKALEDAIAALPPLSPEEQVTALQAKLERIRQIAHQPKRFVVDVLHEIRAEVDAE